MNFKNLLFISIICLPLLNCTFNGGDDFIEVEIPDPDTPVTYNNDIKIIIDNNCIVCHNNPPVNGAPISLTTFSDVRNAVQNNNLINRISRQEGESGAMPAGGPRLPQNLIDQVITWQTDGLLEN